MIKLSHIVKTYDSPAGPVHALKDISLEIARGEIFGIIGLSGAGKSTLIRCINMLERPTSGTVEVDGRDLTAMNNRELRAVRKKIGMIFQHFNLLSSATVYDNVAFPLRLSGTAEDTIRAKVTDLLGLVGLADKAHAPVPLSAFRRAEAARRHRARARERPERAALRRGDECARPADDEGHPAPHRRHQQEARPHGRRHHA